MKAALDLICRFTSGIISLFQAGSVGTKDNAGTSFTGNFLWPSPTITPVRVYNSVFFYYLQMKSYVETNGFGSFFGPLCIAAISWTFLGSSLPNLQISGSFEVGEIWWGYEREKGNMIGRYSIHQYMTRWSHTLRDIQSMNEKGIWSF